MMEKILERLSAKENHHQDMANDKTGVLSEIDKCSHLHYAECFKEAKEIVQEEAKEYGNASDTNLAVVSALPSLYPLQPFEEEAIHKVVASAKDCGWIPVSERLPKDLEHVYATCVSLIDDREPWVIEDVYLGITGWPAMAPMLQFGEAKVVAWMPKELPAPYQKEVEIAKGAIAYEGCTNADRIRAMSDEELARFLDNYRAETIGNEWCLHLCPQRLAGTEECDCPYDGYETTLGWLKAKKRE